LIGRAVLEQSHFPLGGGPLDRRQARHVLFGLVVRAGAGRSRVEGIVIRAEGIVVLSGHGEAHRLAGDVLHAKPGLEDQREVDDPKDQHQENGQGQRKLKQSLGRALSMTDAPENSDVAALARVHT
jgi:hypothetical protein